jgi:hypothetical protein
MNLAHQGYEFYFNFINGYFNTSRLRLWCFEHKLVIASAKHLASIISPLVVAGLAPKQLACAVLLLKICANMFL